MTDLGWSLWDIPVLGSATGTAMEAARLMKARVAAAIFMIARLVRVVFL